MFFGVPALGKLATNLWAIFLTNRKLRRLVTLKMVGFRKGKSLQDFPNVQV